MTSRVFTSSLEQDTDGTWWFVHVPQTVRAAYKEYGHRGIIHVRVTIGSTSWDGSILPWADGAGQISVNAKVRKAEQLVLGQRVAVTVLPQA